MRKLTLPTVSIVLLVFIGFAYGQDRYSGFYADLGYEGIYWTAGGNVEFPEGTVEFDPRGDLFNTSIMGFGWENLYASGIGGGVGYRVNSYFAGEFYFSFFLDKEVEEYREIEDQEEDLFARSLWSQQFLHLKGKVYPFRHGWIQGFHGTFGFDWTTITMTYNAPGQSRRVLITDNDREFGILYGVGYDYMLAKHVDIFLDGTWHHDPFKREFFFKGTHYPTDITLGGFIGIIGIRYYFTPEFRRPRRAW